MFSEFPYEKFQESRPQPPCVNPKKKQFLIVSAFTFFQKEDMSWTSKFFCGIAIFKRLIRI